MDFSPAASEFGVRGSGWRLRRRTACVGFPPATLILQIRSTRRYEKPCYASFSPSMTDLRYAKHVKDSHHGLLCTIGGVLLSLRSLCPFVFAAPTEKLGTGNCRARHIVPETVNCGEATRFSANYAMRAAPNRGAMACGPVDAGSCFCEA